MQIFCEKYVSLQQITQKLPQGVVDLVVNDEFGESSSMLVTLESEGKSYREMGDYVNTLSDKLRTVPGLANIVRMGGQKEQLSISADYDNLVSTYKQTQIAQKSITRAEENMRINREHYREGLTTMTVLLDAQRQQQQALSQYTVAVSEYLQAKTKYLILTGRR